MKSLAFVIALLGVTGVLSVADLGEMEMDSWCVTYVSTYLVPVANQEDRPTIEPGEEKPTAEDSGRLPFAPSLRLTFGRNTSSVTGNTLSGSSIVSSEPSIPAGRPEGQSVSETRSSDSTARDLVSITSTNITPTSSDLESITNTNTNTIPTSSELEPVVSTNIIPTSSGIIEPEGRSIIFQVSIPDNPDNEKRSIKKRVSGGFVGNDNPGTCTFANVFNLADGQLFEGGVPIYYSLGEDYKELSGQDIPSEGAIKSTFMVREQRLVFKNSRLPSGEAGFCQDTDGRVYITFTNGPPGCTMVNLAVYGVVQCQNGRLVGAGGSSTTFNVATSEIIDSKTSTIETTSTAVDVSQLLSSSEAIDNLTSTVQSETTETVTESSLISSASLMAIASTATAATVSGSAMVESSIVPISAEEMGSGRSSNTELHDFSSVTSDTATQPSSSDESFSTELNTGIVESTSLPVALSTGVSTSQIPLSFTSSSDPADTATGSIDITTELAKTTTGSLETPVSVESGTEPMGTATELVNTTTELAETTTELVEIPTSFESSTERVDTTIELVDTTIKSADTTPEPAETTTESVSIPASIESSTEPVDIATEMVDPTTESAETATESVEISVSSESSIEPVDITIEPAETKIDRVETTTESAEATPQLADTTTALVETTPALAETTTELVDTPTEDACVAGITNPAGSPPLDERKDDCSANNVVTVSPYTVTVTETLKRRFVWVVPTTWPPTPTKKRVARDEDEATTIFPTEYPDTYATYCENADDYYDACSSLGVVQSTMTLPTPTTTEENPICRAKEIVKRAGEAMGYEFENHWELMTMPGYTMIAI